MPAPPAKPPSKPAAPAQKLARRRAPYFVKITKGLRLGYYRGTGAGTWIVRHYRGAGSYETDALGLADDQTAADNVKVFDTGRRRRRLASGESDSASSRAG